MFKDICKEYIPRFEEAQTVNDFMTAKREFVIAVMVQADYDATYASVLCHEYWPIFTGEELRRLEEWDKHYDFEGARASILNCINNGDIEIITDDECPFCENNECDNCLYNELVGNACNSLGSYRALEEILYGLN